MSVTFITIVTGVLVLVALWLLDHGMDVNARSAVGASGFGGYTAAKDLCELIEDRDDVGDDPQRRRQPVGERRHQLTIERVGDVA